MPTSSVSFLRRHFTFLFRPHPTPIIRRLSLLPLSSSDHPPTPPRKPDRHLNRGRQSAKGLAIPAPPAAVHRPHPTPIIRRLSLLPLSSSDLPPTPPRKPDRHLLRGRQSAKGLAVPAPPAAVHLPSLSSLLPNQAVGFVAAAQANFMRVIVDQPARESGVVSKPHSPVLTGMELLCVVKAVLKKIKRRVLVGDRVLVGSVDWVDRRGMIEDVFERSSVIADPPVANVDHLLVLFSMEQPKLEEFLLTRFLVDAESTGIPFTLAINKVELVKEEVIFDWKVKLRRWGYEPIFCSVESKHGLPSLSYYLKEQTSVIVGPSGVGKSSLINALRSADRFNLIGDERFQMELAKWYADQRVGEVSTRSGQGKHTTRHVSLLPLADGGYLADTPGFNQPSLSKVTKRSLANMFPEVRKMLHDSKSAKCSFNDCLHLGEPGCVVKGDWERYPYYLQLLDELKIREDFQIRTFGTKKESDVRYKVGEMGVKQAEPRLEPKKHRRESRKRINQSILNELDSLVEYDSS